MGFLTQNEINSMIKDMNNLLNAPEAQTTTLRWQSGHTGVWDAQYKRYVGGAPIYSSQSDVKCIVSFLRESDIEDLAEAHIDVKIGDAVFYFENTTDFSAKEDLRITHKNIQWYPTVPQPAPFELSGVPLGSSQMAVVLLCTRIKKIETTDGSGGGVVI